MQVPEINEAKLKQKVEATRDTRLTRRGAPVQHVVARQPITFASISDKKKKKHEKSAHSSCPARRYTSPPHNTAPPSSLEIVWKVRSTAKTQPPNIRHGNMTAGCIPHSRFSLPVRFCDCFVCLCKRLHDGYHLVSVTPSSEWRVSYSRNLLTYACSSRLPLKPLSIASVQ